MLYLWSSGRMALPPASAWEGQGRCCSLETFHVSLLLGAGCARQHYRWVPRKCQTSSCTAQGLWAVCSSPLFVSLPARTHLGFHQLPAHCGSLSPLRPNPQTPAPLQGGESHPHLASVRPGELWARPTHFMPGMVDSHSFHGKLGGIKVYCEERLELTINQLGHWGIKLNWTWDLGSKVESNSFFGMMCVLDQGNKHRLSPSSFVAYRFWFSNFKTQQGVKQVLQFGFLKWIQGFNSAKLFCLPFV